MAEQSRDTLYNLFAEGNLPGTGDFVDLIDSMLNMRDEGFRKTPEHGVEVATPVGYDSLLSLYREQTRGAPLWTVAHGARHEQLCFRHGAAGGPDAPGPLLVLDGRARVGINTTDPQHDLHVAGVLASEARVGSWPTQAEDPIVADGHWHPLTGPLRGCQAIEVLAGASRPGEGRHALLRAVAMNTHNPALGWWALLSRKKHIRCQHAWYGRRCDRLELAWDGTHGRQAEYRLMIRSRCDYGEGVPIRVQMTRLWADEPAPVPPAGAGRS